jgi:hypothetical protein
MRHHCALVCNESISNIFSVAETDHDGGWLNSGPPTHYSAAARGKKKRAAKYCYQTTKPPTLGSMVEDTAELSDRFGACTLYKIHKKTTHQIIV